MANEQTTKPPLIPNAKTIAAMEEPDELAVTYADLAEMMAELSEAPDEPIAPALERAFENHQRLIDNGRQQETDDGQ